MNAQTGAGLVEKRPTQIQDQIREVYSLPRNLIFEQQKPKVNPMKDPMFDYTV